MGGEGLANKPHGKWESFENGQRNGRKMNENKKEYILAVVPNWGPFKKYIQNFKESSPAPIEHLSMFRHYFSLLLSEMLSSSHGRWFHAGQKL